MPLCRAVRVNTNGMRSITHAVDLPERVADYGPCRPRHSR